MDDLSGLQPPYGSIVSLGNTTEEVKTSLRAGRALQGCTGVVFIIGTNGVHWRNNHHAAFRHPTPCNDPLPGLWSKGGHIVVALHPGTRHTSLLMYRSSPCSRSRWSYHGSSSSVTNSSILPARSIGPGMNFLPPLRRKGSTGSDKQRQRRQPRRRCNPFRQFAHPATCVPKPFASTSSTAVIRTPGVRVIDNNCCYLGNKKWKRC